MTPLLFLAIFVAFCSASLIGCGSSIPSGDGGAAIQSLRGRAILTDLHGARRDDLDGSILFHVHDAWGASELTAAIVQGGFTVQVPVNATLEVRAMILGSRWSYDRASELSRLGIVPGRGPALPVTLNDDGEIEVHGRWLPPTRLFVTDPLGSELDGVQIGLALSPGEATNNPVVQPLAYRGATAPERGLLLPDGHLGEDPVADYWIRAPGFVWKKVRVDHRGGGEHSVLLDSE